MRNKGKGNRRGGEQRGRCEGAGCAEGTADWGLAAAGQSEGRPWTFFRCVFHCGPAAAGAQSGNHFKRHSSISLVTVTVRRLWNFPREKDRSLLRSAAAVQGSNAGNISREFLLQLLQFL